MKLQRLIVLALGTTALLLCAAPQRVAACRCLPPSIESSYHLYSDVLTVDAIAEFAWEQQRGYFAIVQRVFKGCLQPGEPVILVTPDSSAACGATIPPETSLINGNKTGELYGISRLAINSCGYNLPEAELSRAERAFLNSRYVCCEDQCQCADGRRPVNCFVNPCDVAPPCPDGQCEANYCGGCNAEFYDDQGYAVCQTTGECQDDDDCPAGQWCRQAASAAGAPIGEGPMECVPFVGEGQACNGFTVPSRYERCEPGLTCDTIDFIADAAGVCRRSCDTSADCGDGQYCATDNLCDDGGRCERDVDCALPDNAYVRPRCPGYGVCDPLGFECRWECGDSRCQDLGGLDFGSCEALFGFGVVNGTCAPVGGCSKPADHQLFPTRAACQSACGTGGCYGDDDCAPGERCNAGEVCNPPPGCEAGEVCPAVCYGQCVSEGCIPGRGPASTDCAGGCRTDDDCMQTGCSGEVCAAEPVFTTCEFRPEYACYRNPDIARCGCNNGRCSFGRSRGLQQCLSAITTRDVTSAPLE